MTDHYAGAAEQLSRDLARVKDERDQLRREVEEQRRRCADLVRSYELKVADLVRSYELKVADLVRSYELKVADLARETARTSAMLAACEKSAVPRQVVGEAGLGYETAQADIRRAAQLVVDDPGPTLPPFTGECP